MPIISISEYKKEMLKDLYSNPLVVKGLDSQQIDVVNDEPDSLLYQNLFPFLRVPDTQTISDTYILLSVDIDKINRYNKVYAKYKTTMWILAHLERMQMPAEYQATRIDYLAEVLIEMFSGKHKFGFSEFELHSNREILLNEKYYYRELVFICDDLRHYVTPV